MMGSIQTGLRIGPINKGRLIFLIQIVNLTHNNVCLMGSI